MIKRFILTLIVCLSTIVVLGQTKTPYEKKKEDISIRYFKKMGVSMSEINRAKNADPSGLLVLLLVYQKIEQYAITNPIEAMLLIAEFDKEMKAAEKLKSAEDYRREEAQVQKKQQEQTQKERERVMTNAKADLRSGDYEEALDKFKKANSLESTEETTQLIREVKLIQFISSFASKNRHEIVELVHYPYDMGLLPAIKNKSEMLQRFDEVFDDYLIKLIGNSAVSDWEEGPMMFVYRIWSILEFHFDGGDVLIDVDENGIKIIDVGYSTSLYLGKKKEIIERERNSLHESIRDFENIEYAGITSKERFRVDYMKKENDGFYRLCLWDKSKPWDSQPDTILFSDTYECEGKFDDICINVFKTDKIAYIISNNGYFEIKELDKLTAVDDEEDYDCVCSADYRKYVYLNEHAIIRKEDSKQLSREEVIREIERTEQLKKQQEYIQTASQKFRDGELSQAKLWYEKALKIEYSNGIAESLKQVNEEIQRVNDLKKTLAQRHIYVSNNHSLLENTQIVSQLPTIKKGYDVTYRTCVEYINKTLKDEWETVEAVYNDNLPLSQKREIWIDEDQKILDSINEFSLKVESYKKFNDKISELIANNDKKTLKIFKEKFSPVVVAYLMAL